MMMTTAKTTTPATNALTDLVNTARTRADRARALDLTGTATALDAVATKLDAARTRLVEDGLEYLDQAWAFVDAGRQTIASLAAEVIEARQDARRG